MSDMRWEKLKGFSRYRISDTGILIREAYEEPNTNRYMKKVVVKPFTTGKGPTHITVRLLTDDKKEISRSLYLIIHNAFPDMPLDRCKELSMQRFVEARNQSTEILDLEGEIWKDCIGYKDTIQVSNYGRLKRNIEL